ncbi:Protein translocase subunit SecA [subsurface metagenome]
MVREELQSIAATHIPDERSTDWDMEGLLADVSTIFPPPPELNANALSQLKPKQIDDRLIELAEALYEEKEKELGSDNMRVLERLVMLRIVDNLWVEHLTMMEDMRLQAGWQTLRQVKAVDAYKNEGYKQFQVLLSTIQHDVVHTIYRVGLVKREAPAPVAQGMATRGSDALPVQAAAPQAPAVEGRRPLATAGRKKIGRNEPCPCGSGKKYKHCCGR